MECPQLALLVDWLAASAERTRHTKILFPSHFTDVLARQCGKLAFHLFVTPISDLKDKGTNRVSSKVIIVVDVLAQFFSNNQNVRIHSQSSK